MEFVSNVERLVGVCLSGDLCFWWTAPVAAYNMKIRTRMVVGDCLCLIHHVTWLAGHTAGPELGTRKEEVRRYAPAQRSTKPHQPSDRSLISHVEGLKAVVKGATMLHHRCA